LRLQRFGAYDVDRETRQLRTQGRRIRLQEQPFQILCTLLDRAGSVVTRDVPEAVFAAGNPCRVIREITDA